MRRIFNLQHLPRSDERENSHPDRRHVKQNLAVALLGEHRRDYRHHQPYGPDQHQSQPFVDALQKFLPEVAKDVQRVEDQHVTARHLLQEEETEENRQRLEHLRFLQALQPALVFLVIHVGQSRVVGGDQVVVVNFSELRMERESQ